MFDEIFNKYSWRETEDRINACRTRDVQRALDAGQKSPSDIMALLSPAADPLLEDLALRSQKITRTRFGNTIQLYAPLYISNECSNTCLYCGFKASSSIKRITLDDSQVEAEAGMLFQAGFRHVLLLTGENRKIVSPEDLARYGRLIHRRFASVSIEVYPMEEGEYRLLAENGIDGLTIYQETYDREAYSVLHPSGKKRDFPWRLNAPDRGGLAGFRRIGVGALLGLSDWRTDGFFTALHALYLSGAYWKSLIQVSFPRIRHAPGDFAVPRPVGDREFVHLLCVMRLVLPDAGLLLSTREPAHLRDSLVPLGITMMSAGSRTSPGGYSLPDDEGSQFPVEDDRSPAEIAGMLREKGFDPVWKDWDREFIRVG